MSTALINRALTNVRTELDFLRESNVISEDVYNNILDQIPIKYDANQSRESVGSGSKKEYVEAIYEFEPQQGGDLHIRPGDKIEILEKPSPEWYKGRCNGQTGMFPSNYVKPVVSGSSAMVSFQPPKYEPKHEAYTPQPQYQAPPPQQYQQPFPPASTGYYQQPVLQQQPMVQQEQPQNTGSSQMKKFGSKLGNAAIFGAGATIGSDIVNSIF